MIPKLSSEFAIRVSTSLLNQIVLSGGNFILTIYALRILTPEDFGLFGIGVALSFLFMGLGNALVITQVIVNLPDKREDGADTYVAYGLMQLITLCILFAVCLALFTLSSVSMSSSEIKLNEIIVPVGAFAIANVLKNFFVRLSFSYEREHRALILNVIWLASGITLIYFYSDGDPYPVGALFWILTAACSLSVVVGALVFDLPILRVTMNQVFLNFREHYDGARWASSGVVITWLQNYSYVYLLAFLFGPAGVATANAARIFIAPFNAIIPALTEFMLPKLAVLRTQEQAQTQRSGGLFTGLLLILGVAYVLILMFASSSLVPWVVGDKYIFEDIILAITGWCLVLFFQIIRSGASLILQSLKSFKSLALHNLISALVAITAVFFLAAELGVIGAILGLGLGEFVLSCLLWREIIRDKRVK